MQDGADVPPQFPNEQHVMTSQFSIYLDLVRVLSAFLVVLSHVGHGHLVGGVLWPFTYLGNEAVIVFFVLSGFVIAYVRDPRERDLRTFTAARLARLYTVIVPAMVLTATLDAIGLAVFPDAYRRALDGANAPLAGYGLSLLMVNQSWELKRHFGSNGAYWSIPYEFWYYVVFGAATLTRGWVRILGVATAMAIAGPRILGLMPVWLLGVGLYFLIKHHPPTPGWRSLTLSVGGAVLLLVLLGLDARGTGAVALWGIAPDTWAWQGLVGVCVSVHLYGIFPLLARFDRVSKALRRPVSTMANATLALYLFHLPILTMLHAFASAFGGGALMKLCMMVSPLVVALTIGAWCEAQKRRVREWLLRWLHRAAPGSVATVAVVPNRE